MSRGARPPTTSPRGPRPGRAIALLLLAGALAPAPASAVADDPAAGLERILERAEASLQAGELEAAAREYREALFEGWLLIGTLERLEGRLEAARDALSDASGLVVGPEAAFRLASEFLWLKEVEKAEALFAQVLSARPIPQTHVLIGRAYRDAGEYERARAELGSALRLDPAVRRAHYYLGMVALSDARAAEPLKLAEAEFRAELELSPGDPLAHDQLGLALLDSIRPAEALPHFEAAVRAEPRSLFVYHLGRCQLALDRPAEAEASLRRALELAGRQGASEAELEPIHYQLGQALRRLGAAQQAAEQLREAARLSSRRREAEAAATRTAAAIAAGAPVDAAATAGIATQQRSELMRRAKAVLARSYFNLGVMAAQGQDAAGPSERFARAAAQFERVAAIDPAFAQLDPSLGIAYFNAGRFRESIEPLTRALAAQPQDEGLRRMLATACVNIEAWERVVALLQDDRGRADDPALEFAYGLALLRSGRAREAEAVLAGLVARWGERAELSLLLDQARAAQGAARP